MAKVAPATDGGQPARLPRGAARRGPVGPSASGRGSLVEPPTALRDFTLTSQSGAPVSLGDLRGRVVLLFFGSTNCPDLCQLTLGELKDAKRLLGAGADRVSFVFVGVDGDRDNADVGAQPLGAFDPAIVGPQGDPATLDRNAPEYNHVYRKQETGGSGGYAMSHTATSFLIDPEGLPASRPPVRHPRRGAGHGRSRVPAAAMSAPTSERSAVA